MTVNLGEHQVGFDGHQLGFPSIMGCMAIVVVLPGGLYGYHSAGGEIKSAWDVRGPLFKEYIEDKGGNPAQATRLYGVTHVDNQRGWGPGIHKDQWLAELRAYAGHLGTNCRISGYNLDDAVRAKFHAAKKSAYVEFRRVGVKCNVYVETWDNVTYTKVKPINNQWADNIKSIRGGELRDVVNDIYDPITTTIALRQIHKTKLQG